MCINIEEIVGKTVKTNFQFNFKSIMNCEVFNRKIIRMKLRFIGILIVWKDLTASVSRIDSKHCTHQLPSEIAIPVCKLESS